MPKFDGILLAAFKVTIKKNV